MPDFHGPEFTQQTGHRKLELLRKTPVGRSRFPKSSRRVMDPDVMTFIWLESAEGGPIRL
jgi:hypothetical protein